MCPLFKPKKGYLYYETPLDKLGLFHKIPPLIYELGYEAGESTSNLIEYKKGKERIIITYADNRFEIQYEGKKANSDALKLAQELEGKPAKVFEGIGMSGWICTICLEDLRKGKIQDYERFKTKEEALKHIEKMHPET